MDLESDGSSWSKLPLDLLNMVFERLGFVDFQRAKSVCPAWLHASRQSSPNCQIPWLIMFPKNGKDYCLLLNSEEKKKVYRIQDLGVEFESRHCLAIYGSWLFMKDARYNLFIMNPFTREKISLPSMVSRFGKINIKRTINDMLCLNIDDEYKGNPEKHIRNPEKHISIDFPRLWIDDKTKNYVVLWSIRSYLVYSKRGDNCWKHADHCSVNTVGTVDMVYIDHKIYLYSNSRDVKVLEFSGDILRQIFETQVNYDILEEKGFESEAPDDIRKAKTEHLVVTMTGEFLRVKCIICSDYYVWSFRIYKMDSSNNKWEKLTSLEDEAILLDQGITVLASATEGIDRNSIYFSGYHSLRHYGLDRLWSEEDIFVFSLDIEDAERPHYSIFRSIQLSGARWFVPNFKHT
ncbi:PREDICTED: probable F-box protein At4g22060 [Camelina sativa]|uniref:Probable F-box protein At4g22060 n=1 Tax=Camelina sativa TaxID=90675 RepID=A0ABM1QQN8_CAMSA|nr:PREDICTED: probable F-box protein At4g22060 [Camelina sativa]